MGRSRYSNTATMSGSYVTFTLPSQGAGFAELNMLDGVQTTPYTYQVGDRLDHLAARFYNDDSYWWIIALANNINYPFASGGLIPGRVLQIPVDPKSILNQLLE